MIPFSLNKGLSFMIRYETLILTVPEITNDEASSLESQVNQAIKKAQGSILSFERWGKYLLAYPVRKNDYGIYYLVRFEVDRAQAGQLVKDLRAMFALKFPEVVMRSMATVLPEGSSLEYHKPESLEDTPSRDVDTFLRENKMEGLLSVANQDDRNANAQ